MPSPTYLMHSPPINSQRSWRVFPIRWKLGMVTNYCAVNYLRLLWSDYDCSVRDTHLFISFARWDFFGSDSTDCCTWKVALEAKPDETPDASPLHCKSFNTTSWLRRPKLFLLSLVFCASSHMCCLLNITYANRGSIILYPQTTFSQILGPPTSNLGCKHQTSLGVRGGSGWIFRQGSHWWHLRSGGR